jgi:release factor glutamine methyltransferase
MTVAAAQREPQGRAGGSIEAVRRSIAREFRSSGLDSPDLDARLIVGHALGLDHAALAAQGKRLLVPEERAAIAALVRRRLCREPTARIVGYKEFWGLRFKLGPETFVPRPETETVVEAALQALGERRRCSSLRIADIGTGAGTLLLALLSELRGALGVGTDISPPAVECARDNAVAQGATAGFVVCSFGTALQGPFDLLVCNPPYILRNDIAAIEPEVRMFDPHTALDGGPDGLDGYRAIAADARRLLAPDGILVVELGFGQAGSVQTLLAAAGLASAPPRHDLSGTPRALVARRLL